MQQRYRPIIHAQSASGSHAEMADELGLTDFLVERFAVAGTPKTVRSRLADLQTRGVNSVWVSLRAPDKHVFLKRWNAEIAPALAG